VGSRSVLDSVVKRKISSPRRESNPRTPIVLPVAQPRVKRPGHEADHIHPSNAKVKNDWEYTSTLEICLYGVVLFKQWLCLHGLIHKHRGNFTFTFTELH
jgi:hypothetical protein